MLVRAADVVEQDSPGESQPANEKDVVGRRAAAGLQVSEELAGQNAIAAHAKQQARGTQSSGQSAAEGRDDQDRAHGIEQQKASNPATDVHEGGLKIRKRVPVGPHACP